MTPPLPRTVEPEVLSGFLEEALGYLPQIRASIAALTPPSELLPAQLEEAYRQAHIIKGASAMVGLTALSKMAEQLELALERLGQGSLPNGEETRLVLLALVELIESTLRQTQEGALNEAPLLEELARVVECLDECGQAPQPAPPLSDPVVDDDNTESIDPELLAVFTLEAEDHLRTISALLPALSERPGDKDLLQQVRRAAHTLKGSGAMVGFKTLTRLAHRMEDLLDLLFEGDRPVTPEVMALLVASTYTLEELATGQSPHQTLPALYARYNQLLAAEGLPAGAPAEAPAETPAPVAQAARQRAEQFVRVPLERLDELVRLVSELVIARGALEQQLRAQRQQITELQLSTERLQRSVVRLENDHQPSTLPGGRRPLAVVPSRGEAVPVRASASAGEFDELELDRYTDFHLVLRALSENSTDLDTIGGELARLAGDFDGQLSRQEQLYSELQDRLMRVRMVPLSHLASRLRRTVRGIAQAQGKQIEVILEGEDTELDKTVLEELAEPLLHLLRNAADHGIEVPAERLRQGKPEVGVIRVRARHEGSQVAIEIQDDGAGIDRDAVRRQAVSAQLLSPEQAEQLDDEALLALLFRPGFTTASQVTEVSGRGVGLDIVKAKAQRLKGTVTLASQPGQGTTCTLRLPLTLAILKALLVKASGQTFALPLASVGQIERLDILCSGKPANRCPDSPTLEINDRHYPRLDLAQALRLRPAQAETLLRSPVLLVNAGGTEVALVVDQLLGGREIVVKNLGNHLRRVHGVSGATILGDGSVVPILNPADLLREPPGPSPDRPAVAPAPARPELVVLVVDDSPSVRRAASRLLEGLGWTVLLARDGLEALEQLHQRADLPDLFLVDIEMPRMDGYELIATLKGHLAYAHIPAVMVTSRAGPKHRAKAEEIGADGYLVKPYQEDELLAIIRDLVPQADDLLPV
jgi:chemosensory pili system protein ChpA (sensor histidine kinase/response regulator)